MTTIPNRLPKPDTITHGWTPLSAPAPKPEPSTRDRLVALALHADDMPGLALLGVLTVTCGRMVDLGAFVDLIEAAPIVTGLTDHSIDPAAVTDRPHWDRHGAIREWQDRQDAALNRLLGVSTAGGA